MCLVSVGLAVFCWKGKHRVLTLRSKDSVGGTAVTVPQGADYGAGRDPFQQVRSRPSWCLPVLSAGGGGGDGLESDEGVPKSRRNFSVGRRLKQCRRDP